MSGDMFTFKNKYSATKTRVSVPSIYRLQNSNFLSKYTKTTSITTSSKPTKIKHLTTFHITKNHQNNLPKYPQTLENKDSIELNQNLQKIL